MFHRHYLCLALGLLLSGSALAKERTWTNADGFEMKAEFVRVVDGVVTFLKGGKLITLPLDKLSEEDQQLIRELSMGKPLPEEDESSNDAPQVSSPFDEPPSSPPPATGHSHGKVRIEERAWTDSSGKKTYARFVRIVGTEVILIRANKVIRIPYYSLSKEDQEYVRDVLTQQGKEDQIPADHGGASPVAGATDATAPPMRPPAAGLGNTRGAGGNIPDTDVGVLPGGTALAPPGDPDDPPIPTGVDLAPDGGGIPVVPQTVIPPPMSLPAPLTAPSAPSLPPASPFPGMASTSPGLPAAPAVRQVYRCSGCQRDISEAESSQTKCPHCGTLWIYKDDGSGNKQFTGVASGRNMAIGLLAVIGIIVLGAVGGFIGIIAAIVRAVCKPIQHQSYRRW